MKQKDMVEGTKGRGFSDTRTKEGKSGGFGKYKTAAGGGEPIDGGGRGQWERNGYAESRELDQPRTDDGKFTYNSVNGKPLKEVSKQGGKSRGTTIPPVLTGGTNGKTIHFKGKNFNQADYDKWAKDNKWALEKSAEAISFEGKIKLAPAAWAEILQEYDPNKRMFGKTEGTKTATWDGALDSLGRKIRKTDVGTSVAGSGEDIEEWETKKGRRTNREKRAIDVARQKGLLGHAFVAADVTSKKKVEQDSGIKHFKDNNPPQSKTVNIPNKPNNPVNKPAPVTPPTTPNEPVKITDEQVRNKQFTSDTVKKDPISFITDNFNELNYIEDKAKEAGFELDTEGVINAIADGKITSFAQVLDLFNK